LNLKIISLLLIVFLFVLSIWFFFWPIVEMVYAMSWEPLYTTPHKIWLFLLGGIAFCVGVVKGIVFLI